MTGLQDRAEIRRKGRVLFEHLADLLTILKQTDETPIHCLSQSEQLARKAEARLAEIVDAVNVV